jgi:MFS family permease
VTKQVKKIINKDECYSTFNANYILALLLLAYILSFIDRLVLSLMVGPIREEFNITDFQFSILHGFAFALLYAFMGMPIGRIVDVKSRRVVVSIGVFSWSLMTCLCGLVQNIQQLFLARVGVGIGEASLSPGAYSLLGDLFKPEKLPRAISIYAMGVTLGGGLAYILGGAIYDFFATGKGGAIPLIGELKPWQSTFFVVGLPGFLVSILILGIKEPRRRNTMRGSHSSSNGAIPVKEVIRFLTQRKRTYCSLILASSAMSIIGYGTATWYPEFLQRTYGLAKAEVGTKFGLIFLIAGTVGTYAGAVFAGGLRRLGFIDANMRLVLLVAIAAWLPATLGPLMESPTMALLCISMAIFLHYAHFGVSVAALQIITPNQMRGQVGALMLFMSNIMGLALGGSFVAFFTDFVFVDDLALSRSIATISGIFYPVAAMLIYWGLSAYRTALREVGHWGEQQGAIKPDPTSE